MLFAFQIGKCKPSSHNKKRIGKHEAIIIEQIKVAVSATLAKFKILLFLNCFLLENCTTTTDKI